MAQASHASMMFMTKEIRKSLAGEYECCMAAVLPPFTAEQVEWIEGSFTKVCVGIGSEAELLALADAAREAGLEVNVVTDNGQTEFHGVKTITCAAIGPNKAEDIDKITGHLKLL